MRHMTMVTLVGSILVLAMQCGENESLNLNGEMNAVSFGFHKKYFFGMDSLANMDSLFVRSDSIIWLYQFPSGGPSRLSIIISGKSQPDLEVETYTDSGISIVPVLRHTTGIDTDSLPFFIAVPSIDTVPFIDTVPIAASYQSGLILRYNTRLFVRYNHQILDTIKLANPQSYYIDRISPPETVIDSQPFVYP